MSYEKYLICYEEKNVFFFFYRTTGIVFSDTLWKYFKSLLISQTFIYSKGGTEALQKWHFSCLYIDCLILPKVGINVFTQIQIQLYTLILKGEVGQSRLLVWLVCGIKSLHWIVSRHRATLTWLCKDALFLFYCSKVNYQFLNTWLTNVMLHI